jgi:hypothetical protein
MAAVQYLGINGKMAGLAHPNFPLEVSLEAVRP